MQVCKRQLLLGSDGLSQVHLPTSEGGFSPISTADIDVATCSTWDANPLLWAELWRRKLELEKLAPYFFRDCRTDRQLPGW